MKKHTIIGTAGHIDHGKTAVIKALTGIDADRLKEEKERGITIDIGFAYWRDDVTIMDVPGHEKFIRNMVAGVSTIDFFLLVVSADDGIMPQTREHLDILNFFNIRDGLIVLNKIDLVEAEWLELVRQDILILLKKYNLDHLPIIPVSAVKNTNIDLLRQSIENKIQTIRQHHSTRPFRLSVDRSFQIKGFGTVVTGTVLSGNIAKGDEIEIYPRGKTAKIRGLQIHTRETDRIETGFRAAVNLAGIAKEEIVRGDVLAPPASMLATTEFSGKLQTVSDLPLKIKNRCQVHVYTGTAERPGQLRWYDQARYLSPNQTYRVRIKLSEPVGAAPGDAFLIRLHSPVFTLAGGTILEINPARLANAEQLWHDYFNLMSGNDLSACLERIIHSAGLQILSLSMIRAKLFEQENRVKELIEMLAGRKKIQRVALKGAEHYIHRDVLEQLETEIVGYIRSYHNQNPLKAGINLPELSGGLRKKWLAEEIFSLALQELIDNKKLKYAHPYYSLTDFAVALSRDTDQFVTGILENLKGANFTPPDIDELANRLQAPPEEIRIVLNDLARQKRVFAVNQKLFLHEESHRTLLQFLREYFTTHTEMPVTALKDFINTTRKYAIPIFEYLDSHGFTVRSGDTRKRGSSL